jgi:CheY-like chemotaxis protein
LVDDVLDMARIEVNRMTLARDEIDPRSLVDEAVHIVQDHVAAKRLDLKLDIEPDLPTLWIDRLRIRQVLLNLLVNAARFTEQGHIQIGIARRGDDIVFRVSDTGRGIPPQDLDKIFEEFRSTDQPLSAWHSGTGLGLPISKKLVELHHGHMGVDSVYGQGTTFWFTLPISPVVRGRWTSTEEDPPVTQVGASSRILVAIHEDERVVRVLNRHLDNYRVIHAQDAADGSHIARELQAIGLISEHPIPNARLPDRLLRIQCPLPSARRAAIALGASDLLVKPVSRRDLLAAIEHVKHPIERLLIADDDAEIVRLFRRMLRTQFPASACLEASTGAEALQIMRSKRPDLVLLDLIMPETNGHTVLEEMAADRALADIPVILVTARGQEADDVPGLRGDIRVSKGVAFRTGEVLRCLDAIVDAMTPGWRPIRQAAAAPEEPSLG